jgi:hypothetical protein
MRPRELLNGIIDNPVSCLVNLGANVDNLAAATHHGSCPARNREACPAHGSI